MARPSPPTAAVIVVVFAAGLFTVWLVGQLFRDWLWLTALCFYFPSLLAAIFLVMVAGWLLLRRRRWMACAVGLLAIGPLAFVLVVENRWLPPPSPNNPAGRLRLVHWNVFDGNLGWDRVGETLKALGADAYALSEAYDDDALARIARELGEEYVVVRRGDLAVLA